MLLDHSYLTARHALLQNRHMKLNAGLIGLFALEYAQYSSDSFVGICSTYIFVFSADRSSLIDTVCDHRPSV